MRDNNRSGDHIGAQSVLDLAYYVFRQLRLVTSHSDFSKRILGIEPKVYLRMVAQNNVPDDMVLNQLLKTIRHYLEIYLGHPQFGSENADSLNRGYRWLARLESAIHVHLRRTS